ncbi:hypothetical protein FGO68_gene283 [Halteria grandinella]|uniref:Uncharacterized protein n=1 Tax=Halteria grandinella TaxID=5974 RepID=A0A8J8SVB4_HALGN|nr:hypothetical protein FGO68_gene283 [Halteria grandinella]
MHSLRNQICKHVKVIPFLALNQLFPHSRVLQHPEYIHGMRYLQQPQVLCLLPVPIEVLQVVNERLLAEVALLRQVLQVDRLRQGVHEVIVVLEAQQGLLLERELKVVLLVLGR